MNGEILRDETIEQYHANPAISKSTCKDFEAYGPLGMIQRKRGEIKRPDTEAFRVGRFLDALLTGDDWQTRYVIRPEGVDGRTKAGKEWRARAEADGLELVSIEDAAWARDAREAIMSIPEAAEAIKASTPQVSFRAQLDEYPSIQVQSRPDWWVEDGLLRSDFEPLFPDLKTTSDLAGLVSGRGVYAYGYDMQAALVRMTAGACGIAPTRHELIAVTKVMPCQAAVITLGEDWLEIGERRVRAILARINACAETNHWPRTESPVVVAGVPGWLAREREYQERNEMFGEAA